MRRPVIALTAAAALLTAAGASSAATLSSGAAVPPAIPSTPVTAPFISPNVSHVGTIPLEGVGVSMETVTVGNQVRAFVSGAGGLSIYDATDPTKPELLGHLPIYNWENEDIAVSKDGKTAFLTEFDGILYVHAVDVSNPMLPTITDTIATGGAHTVVCADDPCSYLYGSEGQTYDVRDRANISKVPAAQSWGGQLKASGHNLHQDGQGLWIADTSPLIVFKQGTTDGKIDPLKVTKITDGVVSKDTNYQHNNIRPNAGNYASRPLVADSTGKLVQDTSGGLRDGELLLGNGESNFEPQCNGGSGAFSTWSMVNFDKKATKGMTQVDVLRPIQGDYTNGDPAINEMGCSGHWFTQRNADDNENILVAAAWYEHGTRFLKVNRSTGKISQVGFFQPVRGAASEAFLMPTKVAGKDVVWTIDYHSGIDILTFDQSKPAATAAQSNASWMAKVGVVDAWAKAMREVCQAAVSKEATATAASAATSARSHATMHAELKATGLATFPQLAKLK